jgi:hypothetical protein
MRKLFATVAVIGTFAVGDMFAMSAAHAVSTKVKCRMSYKLNGWSIFYQTAEGSGTITCSNGQHMNVLLGAKGGGLTVGKYKITDGHGKFTGVTDVKDVLGSYAMANAHAGVVNSTRAMALTKGPISLTLTGTGKGWDVGAGFSSFTIKPAHGTKAYVSADNPK